MHRALQITERSVGCMLSADSIMEGMKQEREVI